MEKIRVCAWATTLQANIWSLARHLQARDDFEVVVVTEDAAKYLQEPLARLRPPAFRILEKNDPATLPAIEAFAPHVTVVDNHYPPRRLSPLLVNVWHGFGWKGPEDRRQFAEVFRSIRALTGAPVERSSRFFRWITAGETNREHRIHVTGLAAENVVAAGQAFTDDVVAGDVAREEALRFYPSAFADKRVCLFAPTWHFGRIFSHWTRSMDVRDEIALLERIFERLAALDCALILRMHDRKRFEPEYLSALEAAAARHPLVLVKYKDTDRDNLLDQLVSDFMMSNYSSILTFFYGTGRPSVHIYPVDKSAEASYYRVWKGGRVVARKAPEKSYIWSLPPEENGGLVAESFDALLAAMETALREPDCCREKSARFIAAHCAPYDGQTFARIAAVITELVAGIRARPPRRVLWWTV